MRNMILAILLALMVTGCGGFQQNPFVPQNMDTSPGASAFSAQSDPGPHRLWGEYIWYINEQHDRIDVVPKRQARFHLNAAKFLETYCADCLKITEIQNNGDGTIDVTVRVEHPFPGHPEYTGFDVKGIVMFSGSHLLSWGSAYTFPFYDFARLSWREKGDPELLNPDGWTPRWCPEWDSGSDLPMFNYWSGKYSMGEPTANINGFLNFYTDEERHMFREGLWAERTYHIWLPPGPVVLGYAVEACWEPPETTPVTDPLIDFPYSANQPEAYVFDVVMNNGEVITGDPCCSDCSTTYANCNVWYGNRPDSFGVMPGGLPGTTGYLAECPGYPLTHLTCGILVTFQPDGKYQGLIGAYYLDYSQPGWPLAVNPVYDVFDFTIDLQ